jgi:hypothetical protein
MAIFLEPINKLQIAFDGMASADPPSLKSNGQTSEKAEHTR